MSILLALLLSLQAPDKPGQVLAKKTTDPARDWSLYIPRSFKPGAPFVVSSHGRDGRGVGEIDQWKDVAEKHGFVVACPDYSMASGRPGTFEEDEKVTLAVYKYVTEKIAIDKKAVMISGFSGGGMPTYHDGSRHPELFPYWGARSANWYPNTLPSADELKKCAGVAIYIYYGSKDHELILDQAPKAYDALKEHVRDIKFEKIDGMGHESRAATCADWFMAKVAEMRKRDAFMRAGEALIAKGKLKEGVAELKKADAQMKKQKLGDHAEWRIDELAQAEIDKAAAAEKDAAIKILEDAKKAFAGTKAEGKIAEKLKALQGP